MRSDALTPDEYISSMDQDRREAMTKLRDTICKNLPKGFAERTSNGMISYCVPHSLYPAGYHVDPKQPLPFISIASQKNFIAVYHMGLYSSPEILKWFEREYPKHSKSKLDMGKSCIRFKKPDAIPFKLIGELVSKMTPSEWIALYDSVIRK